MFGDVSLNLNDVDSKEDITEEFEFKLQAMDICIPKIEPLCPTATNFTEENISVKEEVMTTPISFVTPYKVRDPVILLERCDKIWETLKVIKDVQCGKMNDTVDALPSEIKTSEASYIKYQPVLGNNNNGLPNFQFSVKSKRKLFHCTICGRQYTENRALRSHSERIHNIFIPPKRKHTHKILCNRSTDKAKDPSYIHEGEESNVSREIDDFEKVPPKKGENKLHIQSASQSISSPNINRIGSDVQSQKKKKNNTVNNNGNINNSEIIQNEQKKEVSNKGLKQNDTLDHLQHSLHLSTCALCKQIVKDMRKHLVDYHKIESPDFMLKNLSETSIVSENKELKTIDNDDKTLRENKITQKESYLDFENKGKRRASISYENTWKRDKMDNRNNSLEEVKSHIRVGDDIHKCNICLGLYKTGSIHKHVRNHRKRGETKENYRLSKPRCRNSPFYIKPSEYLNLNKVSFERQAMQNEDKNKEISDLKYNNEFNKCSCGRTFRNPYILFTHQKTCTLMNETKQVTTENSANKTKRYPTRSSLGRDSGIGISITIKKKNDSYEIIDKDSECEKNLEDYSDSKNTAALVDSSENSIQTESQNQLHRSPDSSKYSTIHSILKIQSVDEDIDIDIEEDSQNNFCNDNITDSANNMENDFYKEGQQKDVKVEPDDKVYQEYFNSDLLQNRNGTKNNCAKPIVNLNKKYNICLCGQKFYTRKALEIHINKHHPRSQLMCGYCKVSFSDVTEWNTHHCSVNIGKKFINQPMEINCQYCNAVINTYKRFDEHIRRKHYDRVVPFQCYQCTQRFSNVYARTVHFNTEHRISFCSLCNNKCNDVMKSRHKAYHYGLGFPCHFCKKAYTSRGTLLKHESRAVACRPDSSFTCSAIYALEQGSDISYQDITRTST